VSRRLPGSLVVCVVLVACGGDDDGSMDPCGDSPSLEILDPVDGQTITPSDDADPSTSEVDYTVTVLACGFGEEEQVELHLLEPVESRYGVAFAEERTIDFDVPLLPGDGRFEARSVDGMVRSEQVAFTVETM